MVAKTKQYRPEVGRHQLQHIAQKRLDHIVRQVRAEDYHVERFSSFHNSESSLIQTALAVKNWAESANLKVTFNYEYDICLFELS